MNFTILKYVWAKLSLFLDPRTVIPVLCFDLLIEIRSRVKTEPWLGCSHFSATNKQAPSINSWILCAIFVAAALIKELKQKQNVVGKLRTWWYTIWQRGTLLKH
ncbi:hypothetical protein RYX36_014372 [Vicia faba]